MRTSHKLTRLIALVLASLLGWAAGPMWATRAAAFAITVNTTADDLTFDGVSYDRLSRALAAVNLADNASGKQTQRDDLGYLPAHCAAGGADHSGGPQRLVQAV